MKKWFAILLCTLGLLVLAAMCPPPPEQPVCPEGQITVTESVWVAEVPAVYACPANDSAYTSHDWRKPCARRFGFLNWRYANKVLVSPAIPAHWTDPVCRLPEVGEEVFVDCTGVYLTVTTEGIPAEPETLVLWGDSYTTETFLFKDVLYTEPSECLKTHCEVQGVMWYQCNSGAWLYGTGALRDCPWCGGLNGTRVVKESYDCGSTFYWYLNGVPVSAPPQPLGRYSCNTKDCFGK